MNTAWDNTVTDGYGGTDHYVIGAHLHVDGLKEFIAAGHH